MACTWNTCLRMAALALVGFVVCAILACCAPGDIAPAESEGTMSAAASNALSENQQEVSGDSAQSSQFSAPSEQASRPPSGQTQVLACIGDSITYGYGLPSPETDAWPALLQQQLGDNWKVVNLGEPGAALMDECEYPYRSTGHLETAKELGAAMFIVMLGSNDVFFGPWDPESYRTQLAALVEELRASAPNARIVLMAPPRTFYDYDDEADTAADPYDELIGGQIRATVRETAAEKRADYVDLYALTERHPDWFPDCVHPNQEANRAIADYLLEELFAS